MNVSRSLTIDHLNSWSRRWWRQHFEKRHAWSKEKLAALESDEPLKSKFPGIGWLGITGIGWIGLRCPLNRPGLGNRRGAAFRRLANNRIQSGVTSEETL